MSPDGRRAFVITLGGFRLVNVADGTSSVSVPVTWGMPAQPSAVPAFVAAQVAWLPAAMRARATQLADRSILQVN